MNRKGMLYNLPKWLRVVIPTALVIVWFTISGIGGPYFGKIEEVSDIDLTAFLPKSAEATKVNEQLGKFRSEKTLPAIVLFQAKDGTIDETQVTHINNAAQKLTDIPEVAGSISPAIVADDKEAAFVVLPIDSTRSIPDALKEVRESLNKSDLGNTKYGVTGPAGFAADLNTAFGGIDGILLLTALAVVFVILLFVYRSILLPILVLLSSIFALSASIFIVWWLAKWDILQLNGQVQGILFILVIGAATDYALLYVSRYREELYQHGSKWVATHSAMRGALEPIAASGGTVMVGLLCLLLSDLGSNKALGPVGAIGIAMAMLSSLTFLPAVLYALGRASFWPVMPRYGKAELAAHKAKLKRGLWQRVGNFVAARPRPVWMIAIVVLGGLSFGLMGIKANGVDQSDLILGYSEARETQKDLNKHFPDGSGSPAFVIAPEGALDKIVAKADTLQGVDGIAVTATGVDSGFKPLGKQEASIKNKIRTEVQKTLDTQKADIEAQYGPFASTIVANLPTADELVEKAYPFKDAKPTVVDGEVLVQVTLTDSPDSDAAKQTIERLRENLKPIDERVLVGGATAAQLDTNNASIHDRTVIIPVVLVAITFILMLLLRSVVAPILLLFTTVLSFGASLGVASLLFNNVWNFPGADPSVILYAFVFLVALGIDYNIFLMTRVREETIKHGTAEGVIKGLVVTGGVITSAGVVLASTFAALGVIPILFLFQLAFIVAFGVLLDTFVVRSLLVPALIRDIGPFVWWPSKLKNKA